MLSITGILIIFMLSGCMFTEPEPIPPVLDINGEVCSIKYGSNSYKASVSHIFQGVTSISFTEPTDLDGIIYSFSQNGCDIIMGDLIFRTDKSFMSETALPQLINDVFANAQKEGALTYVKRDEPKASTLTTATFSGKTNKYSYTITTDFDSGYIREIRVEDFGLILRFAGK